MAQVLFERERRVLEFVAQFIQRHGYAPTLKEIGNSVGAKSPATICEHIYRLEEKGFLRRTPGKARGIEILRDAQKILDSGSGVIELPVLGFIAAGQPIQPHTDPNAYLQVAPTMVPDGKAAYVLQVKGSSMIEDGIYDGDYVVVQHQGDANNGDLVIAILPSGFATLKRIYFEQHRIRLQPANPEMSPIFATEVKIQGKVIGLIRKFGN